MVALLVHGVPETVRVWEPLVDALERADVELLALPGFGAPLPRGFVTDKEHYARWLADEVARRDAVDLVAHDWGALLALRVLADRPPNVRSWVSDMGDLDASFRWHDLARTWQTPGAGEEFMAGLLGASIEDRATLLVGAGVPASGATAMAEAFDATMADAILALYRSAPDVGAEWGPGIDRIDAPGLLVASGRDPYRDAGRVAALASRTGAEVVDLPDAGHWWMLEDPAGAAAHLEAFWARR